MSRFHVTAVTLVALLAACATPSEQDVNLAFQRRQLAEAKLSQGEVELAIQQYEESLKLFSRDPETHFGLAEAYARKGKLGLAESHLLETLKLQPDHHEARLNLGVIYLTQERWADAIDLFRKLSDDPTFIRPARALVNLGWAQYKSGDLGGARDTFEQAVRSERGNYVAHLDLGIVLYDQGDVVESIRHFERVLEILENRPVAVFGAAEAEARFRAAQGFVKLGKQSEAISHLEVAAQRGGTGEWGQKSREYLAILK
jgi:type IV pilus assembly protein PilF